MDRSSVVKTVYCVNALSSFPIIIDRVRRFVPSFGIRDGICNPPSARARAGAASRCRHFGGDRITTYHFGFFSLKVTGWRPLGGSQTPLQHCLLPRAREAPLPYSNCTSDAKV